MSDTNLNGPANGGGAATSSGILFEQKLGAYFAAQILNGDRLDAHLGLGSAVPIWLRFETEAPVDDILVATSADGFVAIQAKTTVSLSDDENSPFYRTVEQFVRYWLTSENGNGSLEWNRPLDPDKDRLVLAVSAKAPVTVRTTLPTTLQLFSHHGSGAMNKSQQQAFDIFERCVFNAWKRSTSAPQPPHLLTQLSRLVAVLVVDFESMDSVITSKLTQSLEQDTDPATALSVLAEICGKMMSRRGGGDSALLRNELMGKGIKLAAPPLYLNDIARLRQHSLEIGNSLKRYEIIESESGHPVSITRECQNAVEEAVQTGSLLIIGEPGAGKSGVLNTLARNLRQRGDDVLELAVDRYSVESLEGLSRELRLEHSLTEVIEAWDGPSQGWLIIDALDATRGGKGEAVFRPLIEKIMERAGRWRVIASIRSFDLRMGVKLRELFKGHSPIAELSDSMFSAVRHIVIPRWSDNEFKQLLKQSPALATSLNGVSERLYDLAKVPFNTRLLAELISQNSHISLLNVSSQTELLKIYWQYRVEAHGLNAIQCLKALVDAMITSRSLKAPSLLSQTNAEMIDILCREGVLTREGNDRWVQFRHHLLFDYAAAQTAFDPDSLINGTQHFPKQQAQGLILSPALGFILKEIWEYSDDHHHFWRAIGHLLNNKECDPIMRSYAGRIAAEYPTEKNDLLWLAKRVAIDDKIAIDSLGHICGALAIRFEDETKIPLLPWVHLAAALTPEVKYIPETLRFLLYQLIKRVADNNSLREMLGVSSRVLLSYSLTLDEPGYLVRSSIPFVADTIDTDISNSSRLLESILDPERLQHFGSEEIPALCYNIEKIGKKAPNFVIKVFDFVYSHDVVEERETNLGSSRILPLRSNTRQDYESARYSLGEYFPNFLKQHPTQAIEAVVRAMHGFVARKHPLDTLGEHLSVSGYDINLQTDRSHIWAHDPDSNYGHDGEVLIKKLLQCLREAPEPDAIILAQLICEKASLAIFWARLFLAANERDDSLIDIIWPIASQEIFIRNSDTRKDAIDLVSKGIERRSKSERYNLEKTAFMYDFSEHPYQEEAKNRLLCRLFNTIGSDNLCTDAARILLKNTITDNESLHNDRIFRLHTTISSDMPYHYIDGLNIDEPDNKDLIKTIETAKSTLGLDSNRELSSNLSIDEIFSALEAVRDKLSLENIHSYVRTLAEDVIAKGCSAIISKKMLPLEHSDRAEERTWHFLELLQIIYNSTDPTVDEDTEENFAQSVGWGSPAPRIDAAQILIDVMPLRPDLYARLKPDIKKMLNDPHPAVRFQISARLLHLWEFDQETAWEYLSKRLEQESNTGIIEHMVRDGIGRLLHTNPQRVFDMISNLLNRFDDNPEHQKRIRNIVSSDLAILWCVHNINEAYEILQHWIVNPTIYKNELNSILVASREGFVLGLSDQAAPKDSAIRQRISDMAFEIIDSAGINLEKYYSLSKMSDTDQENAKLCAQIIDTACSQLRFACEGKLNASISSLNHSGLKIFLNETERHLRRIGDCGTPHTIYYLLELLETLIPVNPDKCFDLMAHALRHGTKTGFQNESMGMDQLVKMMGIFLADYKIIFENECRRERLIDSLDIFMAAGWPAARRLLYRLPEFIQ